MTHADRMTVAVIAVIAVLAWPLAAAWGAGESVVITGPSGTSVVPLRSDATLQVQGTLGIVTVRVGSGRVRVTESSCPDHICVRSGSVARPGSVIACVPNGVVVRVGQGGDDGLDTCVR